MSFNDREKDALFGLLERMVKLCVMLVDCHENKSYLTEEQREDLKEIKEWMNR